MHIPQKRVNEMVEKNIKIPKYNTLDLQSAYHQIPINENKSFTAFEPCGNLYQFYWVTFVFKES